MGINPARALGVGINPARALGVGVNPARALGVGVIMPARVAGMALTLSQSRTPTLESSFLSTRSMTPRYIWQTQLSSNLILLLTASSLSLAVDLPFV